MQMNELGGAAALQLHHLEHNRRVMAIYLEEDR